MKSKLMAVCAGIWFCRWMILMFLYLCAVTPRGGGLDWDWFVVGP